MPVSRIFLTRMTIILPPCLAFLAFHAAFPPSDVPLLEPDSASYVDFSPARNAGYPAFLAFCRVLGLSLEQVPGVHGVLYAVSTLILLNEILKVTRSAVFTLGFAFLALANPFFNQFHFQILTESTFFSTTNLFIAFMLAFLRTRTALCLAVMSACVGLALAVRPVGWAFVPLIPMIVMVVRRDVARHGSRFAISAVLPILLVVLGSHGYYKIYHPDRFDSLAPLIFFAKAGMVTVSDGEALAGAESQSTRRTLLLALEKDLAPVRAFVAGAPSFKTSCLFLISYEVFVQYQFATEARDHLARETGRSDALLFLAFTRLAAGWKDYLRLTLYHYACLWEIGYSTTQQVLLEYLARNSPYPFEGQIKLIPDRFLDRPIYQTLSAALIGVGIATGLLALLGLGGVVARGDTRERGWKIL